MAAFKYRAFISYSHQDRAWVEWLHKALESYRLPKQLVGTETSFGPVPEKLFPIYRDRDEFPAAADLAEHVRTALEHSASLIVVCSPAAAQSRWVNEEILTFKRLGRAQRILPVIVSGEPGGDPECFPAALTFKLGADGKLSNERIDPAAADARAKGDGKDNAKLKLIAGILGTDYDALKQRDAEAERRRARLYRTIAISMGMLALISIAGGLLTYHYAQRSEEMRKAAEIQATTAEKSRDFMVSLFSIANPEENRGNKITAREMLDRGVAKIDTSLKDEPIVRANLLRAMGQSYTGLGLYPKAGAVLDKALAEAKRGGRPDDILEATLALAANHYTNGDYAGAERLYRGALSDAQTLHGSEHASVSEALNGLGDALSGLDRKKEAEENYRRALGLDLKLHGEQSRETARSLTALGTLLYFDGRYAQAEPLFRRALAIRKAIFGPRDASIAVLLNNLGALDYETGHYDRAEASYEEALPVYRAVFGDSHPEVAVVLNNLGRVQLMRNKRAAAKATLAQALAMDRTFLSADDDTLIPPLNSLGMLALARADLAEAQTTLEDALRIATLHQSWMLDQVLGNCVELYQRTGRVAEAEKTLALARQTQSTRYGTRLHTTDAWRKAVLDTIDAARMLALGDSASAAERLSQALPILQARFGKTGFYPVRTAKLLAAARRAEKTAADRSK
ncbi:MAG TPA: toll/interleukin-1 receptor domain-containing protein [Rhizomicrobium sp.]|nr:toll/interleukin-1 receptor domain-containing protein [Rhizomicrobium sp.]